MRIKELSRKELEKLFEERKKALLEVRDEIDRRDRDRDLTGVDVDFTKYVEDGNRD
jgi:hypothetical protein